MRVGIGYDVHKLTTGRDLVLGGIKIPFEKGLYGHSDADVLLHALCDSILGAMGEGDIGKMFPNDDPGYKDLPSTVFLEKIRTLMEARGFEIHNIDTIIVAEKPKIAPHVDRMKDTIAAVLKVSQERINIKATTTEGLGFCGKGEGMAAYSCCTLKQKG